MKISTLFFIVAFVYILPFELHAQMADTKILGLKEAETIANAAQARALKDKWNVVIAIVDAGGHLVYLKRMDGTQIGSIDIAIQKAKTSVYFKRPSKIFEQRIAEGANALLTLPNMLPLEGGLPIEYNGQIIGAIGVSGVTAQQDGIIAQAGVDALR